jgi:hypothetical protein
VEKHRNEKVKRQKAKWDIKGIKNGNRDYKFILAIIRGSVSV